jgi:hypothetical protein
VSPDYLRYAEALATDLEVASQPVSAQVVRRLMEERAVLLAGCEAMVAQFADKYSDPCDLEALEAAKVAVAKAKEANP